MDAKSYRKQSGFNLCRDLFQPGVNGDAAAVDMTLPGIYAYYSVLDGGTPKAIPNLRLKQERDKVRDDDRRPGRDLPTYSKCELDIDDSVYEKLKAAYLAKQKKL